MGSNATRTCPECGSPNSGLSLFCSECGASLSGAPGHLASEADDQTTATFRPVDAEPVAPDPYATQTFRVAPTSSPPSPAATTTTATETTSAGIPWAATATTSAGTLRDEESRRGLVLGWIAAILILLVIGFFAWASLLDADTRDSILGFFP